jgi:flagellar hook-associated protein 3 FlgL
MRVSTAQSQNAGVQAILDQQNRVNRTQIELSSGKKILKPSDDPSASAQLLSLDQSLKSTEQYQSNIQVARQRLQREESTFDSITNLLQRVRELAVQANNDSQSNDTRAAIAQEIGQRFDELLNLANTRDANGEYLFSGFQGFTQPFTQQADGTVNYNGDQGQRLLQISTTRQVAVTDNGFDVFQNVPNGNRTFTTLDNPANNGSGIITPGSVSDPTLYDQDTYTVLFPVATSAGGTLTFNDQGPTNDTLSYTLNINGTNVYTVDDTGTPPAAATLDELAAQINQPANISATGVRAYVSNGALYLGAVSPSTTDISVTESFSGFTPGEGDSVTGYFGSSLDETTSSATQTLPVGDATNYLVVDSTGNVETSGQYVSGSSITVNGITTTITGKPANGDSFTLSPSGSQDLFTTLQNLITTLQTPVADPSDSARFHNSLNRFLSDVDLAGESVINSRSRVGARLSALDSQENTNSSFTLSLQTSISDLQDLDYADAISRFNTQLVGLQAAQQAFVKVQNLSLFNFL